MNLKKKTVVGACIQGRARVEKREGKVY